MQARKSIPTTEIIDAIDMLATLAEGGPSREEARLKAAFHCVLQYMKGCAGREQLQDDRVRQGLHAVMALAREAAVQLEKAQGENWVALPEMKELELFYQQKVSPHIPKKLRETKESENAFISGEELLHALEKVQRDEDYELFLIRQEGGGAYFTPTLLHHIRLVAHFDALLLQLTDDQSFQRLALLSDQECHERAKGILKLAAPLIDLYYKEALKFKQVGFVMAINSALMALMLAVNPRNQLSNMEGKGARGYYRDFHFYLRAALSSVEYKKMQALKPEHSGHFLHTVLLLSLDLCSHFFLKTSSRKEEISLIQMWAKKERGKGGSPWQTLLQQEEGLRAFLQQHPNAPLMKAFQLMEQRELLTGFDPLSQGVYPYSLYQVHSLSLDLSVMKLPSPTRQEQIDESSLVPEFKAWIRSLKTQQHHHLLVNVQDRTTWKEKARSSCLERGQEEGALTVITLDTGSDFAHQKGVYAEGGSSSAFLKICKEQICGEKTGFYFPEEIDQKLFHPFVEQSLKHVHQLFFAEAEVLSVQHRCDLLSLLYPLLVLKVVELLQIDSLSFSCKDGVDIAAPFEGQFFAVFKGMQGGEWTHEDHQFLMWMLYAPALLVRQRLVAPTWLHRVLHALEVGEGKWQELSTLYAPPFLRSLRCTY